LATHRVVGRPLPRIDAIEKATGEARYIDDCFEESALFVATLGSPSAHIRIRRLDITSALQTPGVIKVLTARDIPGTNRLPWWPQPFLVEHEALYHGAPIALVIAESEDAARIGVDNIHIDYESLPHVTSIESALKEDAPALTVTRHGRNVWFREERSQGDIDEAFSDADVLLQRTYHTPFHATGNLEPAGVIAEPDPDGGIIVSGSLEPPFAVQESLATLLELPYNRIRIVQRPLGGSGGAKAEGASLLAGHAALAAWLTGRQTRMIYSSTEDFLLTGKQLPCQIKVKCGALRDGTILGCHIQLLLQGGAYISTQESALKRAIAHAVGPYNIPNVHIDAKVIATHHAPYIALNGYGQSALCFAIECLLDELSQKLSLDPLALRRQNMLTPGAPMLWEQTTAETCQLPALLEAVEEASNWHTARTQSPDTPEHIKRGIGIALSYTGIGAGYESSVPEHATASIQLQRDGTVLVATAHAETGQGSRTLLAQMVADDLAAPYESIRVLESDTTRVTDGSRRMHAHSFLASGHALLKATAPLRQQLIQTAARMLYTAESNIILKPGRFISKSGKHVSFTEVVETCWNVGMPMAQYGWYALPHQGDESLYPLYAYAAQIAEVEIDMETFDIRVCNIYSAHDIGHNINPMLTQSAVESGVIQGLGLALLERLSFSNGEMNNGNLRDYTIPSMKDLPHIKTFFLQEEAPNCPFGYKSLGASPLLAIPPAIINAITHAIGVPIDSLPVTPEALYELLSADKRYSD